MIGLSSQSACLLLAIGPALWEHLCTPLSTDLVTYSLVSGLAASRFGLYTFDLTMTQRLQADVATNDLGESSSHVCRAVYV